MPIPPRYPLLSEMRVEQVTANQVREVLANTASRLDREIAKMDDSTNPITRAQAEAQRRAVKAYMASDWNDIEKATKSGRIAAAEEASRVVSRYENQLLQMVMDPAAVKALVKSEAQRAASGVDLAVRRMQGASYVPLSKQVYYTQALADGWVDEVINQGLASGWSQRQIAKAVRNHISPSVPGGVSYAANRMARTEVNNAFHASAAKRYEDSAIVEEVEWHLSSSHPEGDICDSLAADGPYKKNKVPQKPHPHCYCFITPKLPTDEEFMANLFAGKYGDEPWVKKTSPAKVEKVAHEAVKTASKTVAEYNKRLTWAHAQKADLPMSRNFAKAERAVRSYVGLGYERINGALRGGQQLTEIMEERIADLKSVTSSKTVKDAVLNRGMMDVDFLGREFRGEKFDPAKLVGKSFQDKGFVSTSYGGSSGFEELGELPVQMEILAPKGTRGSLINNDREREFLLDTDTTFTILDAIRDKDGTLLIRAVITSQEAK